MTGGGQLSLDLVSVSAPSREDWQHVEVWLLIDVPGQAWRDLLDGQRWTPDATNASIANYCHDILGTPVNRLLVDPPGWHTILPQLAAAGADVEVSAGQPWRPDDEHYYQYVPGRRTPWPGDDAAFAGAARDLVETAARTITPRQIRDLLIERGVWYPELPAAVARVEQILATARIHTTLDTPAADTPAGG